MLLPKEVSIMAKIIPSTPNKDRYIDNIYFGQSKLRSLKPNLRKKKNISSSKSEDAVTWNVLYGLLELITSQTNNKPPLNLLDIAGASLLFWNCALPDDDAGKIIEEKLRGVCRRIEAKSSEIDAILWRPKKNRLTFIEAKLSSGPGVCQAARKSLPDISDPNKGAMKNPKCRLYRTSKSPRDNGCSYWGDGKGGDVFHNRFPKNFVAKYLGFNRPIEEQEHHGACAIYYQLMRNVILGKEIARELGENVSFDLIALVAEGKYDTAYYKNFNAAVPENKELDFNVISWQQIGTALPSDSPVRKYLEQHTLLRQ